MAQKIFIFAASILLSTGRVRGLCRLALAFPFWVVAYGRGVRFYYRLSQRERIPTNSGPRLGHRVPHCCQQEPLPSLGIVGIGRNLTRNYTLLILGIRPEGPKRLGK